MRNSQNPPHVTLSQILGFAAGGSTLIFFMLLVLLNRGFCENRYWATMILAVGVALSFGFLGGDAKAKGEVRFGEKLTPFTFGVTGGAGFFIIILVVFPLLINEFHWCDSSPAKPSTTLTLPVGTTMQLAISALEHATGCIIVVHCPPQLLQTPVEPGTVRGATPAEWLDHLRIRMRTAPRYRVQTVKDDERYEITCL